MSFSRKCTCVISAVIFFVLSAQIVTGQEQRETVAVSGLEQPVEIIRDRWGISHIYAQNQRDLFFAQGYSAARDRLFQFEVWRRNATGTMAEILGESALKSDIGARLFKPRVDIRQEMNHYHPDGEEIITSFVRGINAYIDMVNESPDLLPVEFHLLGIRPQHWTPWEVVSRHNGLRRNVGTEARFARYVKEAGLDNLMPYLDLEPGRPELTIPDGLDLSIIPEDVLDLYNASRRTGRFGPEHIVDAGKRGNGREPDENDHAGEMIPEPEDEWSEGSNNWVISGRLTASRFPVMANDPHRSQQVPSLRYWAHLVAPGWNVIGGGEPVLPGLSIGHNEYGAWGLTIFSIDQEDLYVYDTNPDNPNQYRYKDLWVEMEVIPETFEIKGGSPVTVDLKFTRHGPVVYEDAENHKAYALRAAWLEIGGAPYLASLRFDQAKSWEEFREACSYSHIPSENMIWADIYGNIGWQAVGITPIRKNWYGLLPVPGDGKYEWDGYLPIQELPNAYNPEEGYIATANQNNMPHGYPYRLGYSWAAPFRFNRIAEVLGSGRKFTMTDMMRLQHDELSLPARALVPLIEGLTSNDRLTQEAIKMLLRWDYVMDMNSVAAVVYSNWERNLVEIVNDLYIPEVLKGSVPRVSLQKTIDLLTAPDGTFGENPIIGRDDVLVVSLEQGVDDLVERLGPDMRRWQYGQERFHHIKIDHMLSDAVNESMQRKLNVGPLPRGGYGSTPNQTGNGFNQRSGASFRIIADTGNWDNSVGTNNPGQSGNPDDPHYRDLFGLWANGKYFPVFYSRRKVESVAETTIILRPQR